MKLKTGKSYLVEYGLILLFLLDICFWYIIPMNTSFTGVYNKKLMTIIGVVLTLDVLFTTKEFKKKQYKFLNLFCIAALFQLVSLTMYTMAKYPRQGLFGTLAMGYYFMLLFTIYPIIYCFERRGMEHVLIVLNTIAVILLVVIAVQGLLYSFSSFVFMRGVFDSEEVMLRNNRIRIGLTLLGNIFVIYNFNQILNKHYQRINYVGFLIGILDVFLVQMTRMYSLAIIGALLAVYLTSTKKSKRFVRVVIVLFTVIYAVSATNIVDSFIASFNTAGEYGAGTRVRLEAIEYFWSFVRSNPLFGMGLVNPENYGSILYGVGGRYYLSDVGIVGLITQGGWTMAALYFVFIGRMVFVLRKVKNETGQYKSLLWGLFIFTLLCTPTLIIWGRRTIIYVALILSIFECCYHSKMKMLEERSSREY